MARSGNRRLAVNDSSAQELARCIFCQRSSCHASALLQLTFLQAAHRSGCRRAREVEVESCPPPLLVPPRASNLPQAMTLGQHSDTLQATGLRGLRVWSLLQASKGPPLILPRSLDRCNSLRGADALAQRGRVLLQRRRAEGGVEAGSQCSDRDLNPGHC